MAENRPGAGRAAVGGGLLPLKKHLAIYDLHLQKTLPEMARGKRFVLCVEH